MLLKQFVEIQNLLKLLKFDRTNITNIPIAILMSKMIFIKYLPPVRPKLLQKYECPEFTEI